MDLEGTGLNLQVKRQKLGNVFGTRLGSGGEEQDGTGLIPSRLVYLNSAEVGNDHRGPILISFSPTK